MSPTPPSSSRGFALVELLVAFALIELAALMALTAAVTAHRLDRAARQRTGFDLARRDTVAAAAAGSCRGAPAAGARPMLLPAGAGRPALLVTIRCGR